MSEEGFKLPTSSYDAITRIIRAYGSLGEPSSPDQVSKLASLSPDKLTKNNGFLVSIGAVEGGKKKKITEVGLALARALEHEMPDEITLHWRKIVLANEFLQKLIAAIRIRKGMDPATLQAHVAYSAGRPKTPEVMTGAAAVVDILRASGLVKEDSGKLVATTGDELTPLGSSSRTDETIRDNGKAQASAIPTLTSEVSHNGMAVTIQIQIQCSANEIDGLGTKIRAMLKELSRPEDNPLVEEPELNKLDSDTESETSPNGSSQELS